MKGQFTINYCEHGHNKYRVEGKLDGKRIRAFFPTVTQARAHADIRNKELKQHGIAHANISSSLRADAAYCKDLLDSIGVSLRTAVEDYYASHATRSKSVTVRNACTRARDWSEARLAGNEVGPDMHRGIVGISRKFEAAFADTDKLMCDLSAQDISNWLAALPVATSSKNSYRLSLSRIFSYAKDQGWVSSNPLAEVKAKNDREAQTKLPGIFTLDEAARLLEAATPELVPYLAIGLFAGLRPTETLRLDWEQIHWDERQIEVRADICKTGVRRFPMMSDNLIEWLTPYRQVKGPIFSGSMSVLLRSLRATRKAAGVTNWPKDGLRHSFCSFHLAAHKNEALTANEAGHSVSVMKKHYLNRRKHSEGAAYFALRPAATDNVVALPAQAA